MDCEGVAIVQEFAAFTERTGIDIALENAGFEADLLNSRVLNNEPLPDVITYVGANVFEVSDFAIDLRTYLDPQELRSDFTPTLMNLATVGSDGTSPANDGAIYSIPIDLDIKGLVFYVPSAFEQAGYEVPQSLGQLLDLSEQIVADGGTPWCFAFNSPSVSAGWPGTDIVESLAARFGGVETYDDWMTHRIPFDNDAVAAAGAYLDRLIFTDGFVRNGPESISATDWTETNLPLLRRDTTGRADPDCWMTHQFDVMFALTPNDTQIGTDLGAFILPPANEGEVAPLTGGSSYAATLSDRPEVRIFTSWMASPEFGQVQAATSAVGNYVSPNARFDSSIYGQPADPTVTPEEISIRLSLATSVQQALAADRFLVDASDFMPDLIGGLPPEGSAFMKGMLDYVDGVRTFDQMTADVEADWVALDNGG